MPDKSAIIYVSDGGYTTRSLTTSEDEGPVNHRRQSQDEHISFSTGLDTEGQLPSDSSSLRSGRIRTQSRRLRESSASEQDLQSAQKPARKKSRVSQIKDSQLSKSSSRSNSKAPAASSQKTPTPKAAARKHVASQSKTLSASQSKTLSPGPPTSAQRRTLTKTGQGPTFVASDDEAENSPAENGIQSSPLTAVRKKKVGLAKGKQPAQRASKNVQAHTQDEVDDHGDDELEQDDLNDKDRAKMKGVLNALETMGNVKKPGRLPQDVEKEMRELNLVNQAGQFPGLSMGALEKPDPTSQPSKKKNRRYDKVSYNDLAFEMSPRIKRLEDLTRLCFLTTLSRDTCCLLVKRVFPEYQSDAKDAWVNRIGQKRVLDNCSNWKSRTITNMREYIDTVFKTHKEGRDLRDLYVSATAARKFFLSIYNITDFEQVFEWSKDFINLHKSTEHGQWWAKNIFVNIAAYTKVVLDVEEGRSTATVEQKKRLTQAEILRVFHTIPQLKLMAEEPADFTDFYYDENAAQKKRKQMKSQETHDPNEDDLLGCAEPPPRKNVRDLRDGDVDDAYAAQLRGGVYVFGSKKKPASETSSDQQSS